MYKRQGYSRSLAPVIDAHVTSLLTAFILFYFGLGPVLGFCLLYTSDAADDLLCVDLGGRRIIKKKTHIKSHIIPTYLKALLFQTTHSMSVLVL